MALVLIVFPLGLFAVAWVLWGFSPAVAWATAWLLIWLIVITIVPGAVLAGLVFKGLPWVTGKVDDLLRAVGSLVDRSNMLAERAGRLAITPDLWLYTKAAWLRSFLGALWREYMPRRS
jgi:hypothetical protein